MCQGLEILAKRMGHQVEEVVFFGDGENDTAALRACGLGVAMANGTDSAKAAAHLTSRYRNTEDAVARELVRLVAEGEFGEGLQLDLKPLLLDGPEEARGDTAEAAADTRRSYDSDRARGLSTDGASNIARL
jgi:hypothetical protein